MPISSDPDNESFRSEMDKEILRGLSEKYIKPLEWDHDPFPQDPSTDLDPSDIESDR